MSVSRREDAQREDLAREDARRDTRPEIESPFPRDAWPSDELGPSSASGVRAKSEHAEAEPLTYQVYTVSDLEARGPALRASEAPTQPAPAPEPWADVTAAATRLLRTISAWVRAPSPRPRLLDVCRAPFRTLVDDGSAALRTLPWRKIGVGSAIAGASILVLFAAVLTIANLTDDLKPARSSTRHEAVTAGPSSNALAAVTTARGAAETDVIELPGFDDPAPMAARPSAPTDAWGATAKAKEPPPELFEP